MNKNKLAIKIKTINKNIEKKFAKKINKYLKYINKQIIKQTKRGKNSYIYCFSSPYWERLDIKSIENIFQPYKEINLDFEIFESYIFNFKYIKISWRNVV